MIYTVHCYWQKHPGASFYPFPTGCRVTGGSLTRRENLVTIPFAEGQKDISDRKIHGGEVAVGGRVWASSGAAAIGLISTMETAIFGWSEPFYVGQAYGTGSPKYYPVHGCKSITHTIPDGPGGVWIDVECLFSLDPSMP